MPREDSTIQPAGTLPATTPTSPHCSGQKMQAMSRSLKGKKTGKLLDGGPMTPVAASNGTLNPAATGGTTPRNAGDRSPTGRVLGAGPGSTDRRPGYPFAPILRSGMSRLLGFCRHLSVAILAPSEPGIILLHMLATRRLNLPNVVPPHEATGVMLMSDTCVHRPQLSMDCHALSCLSGASCGISSQQHVI